MEYYSHFQNLTSIIHNQDSHTFGKGSNSKYFRLSGAQCLSELVQSSSPVAQSNREPYVNGYGCDPIKFYLYKQMPGCICLLDCGLKFLAYKREITIFISWLFYGVDRIDQIHEKELINCKS